MTHMKNSWCLLVTQHPHTASCLGVDTWVQSSEKSRLKGDREHSIKFITMTITTAARGYNICLVLKILRYYVTRSANIFMKHWLFFVFLLVYWTKIRHRVGLLCFLRSGRSSQRGNEAKQSLGFHFSNITGMQTCRRDPGYLPPVNPTENTPQFGDTQPFHPHMLVTESGAVKTSKQNIIYKSNYHCQVLPAELAFPVFFLTVGLVKIPTLVKSDDQRQVSNHRHALALWAPAIIVRVFHSFTTSHFRK